MVFNRQQWNVSGKTRLDMNLAAQIDVWVHWKSSHLSEESAHIPELYESATQTWPSETSGKRRGAGSYLTLVLTDRQACCLLPTVLPALMPSSPAAWDTPCTCSAHADLIRHRPPPCFITRKHLKQKPLWLCCSSLVWQSGAFFLQNTGLISLSPQYPAETRRCGCKLESILWRTRRRSHRATGLNGHNQPRNYSAHSARYSSQTGLLTHRWRHRAPVWLYVQQHSHVRSLIFIIFIFLFDLFQ